VIGDEVALGHRAAIEQTTTCQYRGVTTPRDEGLPRATYRISWPVMIPLLVGILAQSLAASMINTALPKLARDLGFGPADQSWVVNIYPLAVAAAIVPAARWGDRSGRRRALVAGTTVFALLSAVAPTLPAPTIVTLLVRLESAIRRP